MKTGGTELPIEGILARMRHGVRYAMTGDASWFGPGEPIPASAPKDVEGRQFELPIHGNALIQTKVDGVTFPQLRNWADTVDIVRLLIELRKDQITALDWSITKTGTRTARGRVPRGYSDVTADRLTDFFKSPDKDHLWHEWIRFILEDMFVLDAASIYVQRTKGKDLYALRPLDGGSIKRIVDGHGWTPAPPDVAYQQILHGTAATSLTTDQLIYRPRNPRTNRIYGLGHVEQIIITATLWLRRQAQNLEQYDEGTVPAGLLSAPADWGVEAIAAYQKMFDLQLSGQLGEKQKIKITPSGSKYTPTVESPMKDHYDEWLARIACFAFSVPPAPFVKEQNRATAATQNISSLETGLEPTKKWVEGIINHILRRVMGINDYEFRFRDKEAQDPLERAKIDQIYLAAGVEDVQEVRVDLGYGTKKAEPPDAATPQVPAPPVTKFVQDWTPTYSPLVPDPQREAKVKDAFELALAELGASIAAFATDHPPTAKTLDTWVAKLDTTDLALAEQDYRETIEESAQSGAGMALGRIDIESPGAVTAEMQSDPAPVRWAAEHAAEMLRSDGTGGELVTGTRNMIRATVAKSLKAGSTPEELAKTLSESYAFSADRAALIAKTETGNALGHGLLLGYRTAKMMVKKWLLSNEPNICPLCIANANQGYIPIDQAFISGAEAPLQHPRCRCDLSAKRKKP